MIKEFVQRYSSSVTEIKIGSNGTCLARFEMNISRIGSYQRRSDRALESPLCNYVPRSVMLQPLQRGDSRVRALNTTKDSYAALRVHFQGDRAGAR